MELVEKMLKNYKNNIKFLLDLFGKICDRTNDNFFEDDFEDDLIFYVLEPIQKMIDIYKEFDERRDLVVSLIDSIEKYCQTDKKRIVAKIKL